ncbi:endonuclease domain-containing protein [Actinoplanes sp. NPDC004185]
MVTPACWRWVTDRQTLDGLRAQAATSTDPPSHVLPEHHITFELLRLWDDGRCVVCSVTAANRLVRDHEHASGQLRGLLCSACTTAEGRSDSPLFANYRRRPPVDLLSVEVLYLPLGFRPGTCHLASMPGPQDRMAPFWSATRRSST